MSLLHLAEMLDKRRTRPEFATVLSHIPATAEFGGRFQGVCATQRLLRSAGAPTNSRASFGLVLGTGV